MTPQRFRSMRSTHLFMALLLVLGIGAFQSASSPAGAQAATIRVATSGSDAPGCGASVPCQSIQYAANQAGSGSTILVAGGTYTYKAAVDTCSFLVTRAVVCFVNKNLTILGGFSTGNWVTPDPLGNRTVIDGQSARRGVAVIAFNNVAASLRMEGFTIQNGLAQGTTGGGDFNTFAFGGGIWAQSGTLTLRDMTFRGNRAIGGNTGAGYGGAGSGGAVAITSPLNNAPSTLEGVTFDTNEARGGSGPERGGLAIGGALFTYQARTSGNGILATNNRAIAGNSGGSGNSGGLQADALGGGLAFQIGSSATFRNVTAVGNQVRGGNAATDGGNGFGGGIYTEDASLALTNASIRQNTVTGGNSLNAGDVFGGGIQIYNSNAALDQLEVIDNTLTSGSTTGGGKAGSPAGGGGHIWTVSGTHNSSVTNSIFGANRVNNGAGAVVGGGGGGLAIVGSRAQLSHNTFARNVLGANLIVGQALIVQGTAGGGGTPSVVDLSYSLIAEHTGPSNAPALFVAAGSTINMQRNMFAGNSRDTNADGVPLPPGAFNGLGTSLNAASGGLDANFRLLATSPARNQASGSTTGVDIDNQPRPESGVRDIGADEYWLLDKRALLPIGRK